jgi:hypothetical protein
MLSSLIQDDEVNLVEVYWVRGKKEYGYELGWENPSLKCFRQLQDVYGSGTKQQLVEYTNNDMIYTFDRSDDRQKVSRKIAMKEWELMPFYGIGYKEEVLPIHMFPCTNPLTKRQDIDRTIIRVNNRMHAILDVVNEQTIYYIRYQHASNVDMKKMEGDMDRVLALIRRSVG